MGDKHCIVVSELGILELADYEYNRLARVGLNNKKEQYIPVMFGPESRN